MSYRAENAALMAAEAAGPWGIWCTVDGGVTGFRAAWLKNEAGDVAEFVSRAAATEKADEMHRLTRGSRARHTYTARRLA